MWWRCVLHPWSTEETQSTPIPTVLSPVLFVKWFKFSISIVGYIMEWLKKSFCCKFLHGPWQLGDPWFARSLRFPSVFWELLWILLLIYWRVYDGHSCEWAALLFKGFISINQGSSSNFIAIKKHLHQYSSTPNIIHYFLELCKSVRVIL